MQIAAIDANSQVYQQIQSQQPFADMDPLELRRIKILGTDPQNKHNGSGSDKKHLHKNNEENNEKPQENSGISVEKELSVEEKRQVRELKKLDREVRNHESAHFASAGGYAKGGPVYEYRIGPDGKPYAVSGHVDIDMSEEVDKNLSLRKMQIIARAASAPAHPSAQDSYVAAKAMSRVVQLRQDLAEEHIKEKLLRKKIDTESSEAEQKQREDIERIESNRRKIVNEYVSNGLFYKSILNIVV